MSEKGPQLKAVVTVTEPTALTFGLKTAQYDYSVDVVPVCNAQLGGLPSTLMNGAEGPPIIPKSYTQIAASTDTQHNIGKYMLTRKQNETKSNRVSNASATSANFENIPSPCI